MRVFWNEFFLHREYEILSYGHHFVICPRLINQGDITNCMSKLHSSMSYLFLTGWSPETGWQSLSWWTSRGTSTVFYCPPQGSRSCHAPPSSNWKIPCQVWPLTQFYCVGFFVKISLICLEGKWMIPNPSEWFLIIPPCNSLVSNQRAFWADTAPLKVLKPHHVHCFQIYRRHLQVCQARYRDPTITSRASDENFDCLFVNKSHLFSFIRKFGRPRPSSPPAISPIRQ